MMRPMPFLRHPRQFRPVGWICRVFVLGWLLVAVGAWAATAEEGQGFDAAARQLEDGLFDQAAKSFGDFIAAHPNAERLADAKVLQAHAVAGGLMQRSDFAGAAGAYAKIAADFAASPFRLDAILGEAAARFQLGEFARVAELLTGANLQPAGPTRPAEVRVVRGVLVLAEAHLRLGQHAAGLAAIQKLAALNLPGELAWQRQYLQARLQLEASQWEAALGSVTNLINLTTNTTLRAEAQGMHGQVLERLDRPDEAVAAYEKNLAEGMPAARRREAQVKIVQLLLARGRNPEAAKRIEAWLAAPTPDTPSDLLRITQSELRLKDYFALAPDARKGATNLLVQSLAQADTIVTNAAAAEWLGRAQWVRGWCCWELAQSAPERMPEALAAFRVAAEKLPEGEDQAMARFRWANCQSLLKDPAGAVTNGWWIIEHYTNTPAVRAAIFDQVLYLIVRSSLDGPDVPGAEKALRQLLEQFPNSAYGDRALLLVAQALTKAGKLGEARAKLEDLTKRFPNSPLLAEARRAVARTFVQEGSWALAIGEIEGWLNKYPDHPGRAEAEFDRAWLYWQSGQSTNAFQGFTNFVARFPNHTLAPQAQLWIGDYFADQGDFAKAELNYQILFQNTNWVASAWALQGRLLAGRAAFRREGYASAEGYFKWLITNAPAGDPIVADAYFDLGNTFASRPSTETTNTVSDFENAINAFTRITQLFPTNRLAPLAWGRIGDCQLQLAAVDPRRYERATNAYTRVLEFPQASLAARSKAAVGLGSALEKMAAISDGLDREARFRQALDQFASVLYETNRRPGETETPDPLWMKEAGLAAARVAESQQRWDVAAKVYQRLAELFPPLRPAMEKRIEALKPRL